jgi:5-(carboxyamino)imidazole ribonucleotide mutase
MANEREPGNIRQTAEPRYPLVGIIMGSDSDLPVVKKAGDVLDELAVPYEMKIMSAHRTPTDVFDYATHAHERYLRAIIAAAGGAAALPGAIAAETPLPVIGIPIYTKSLGGEDSLYSMAQMPPGVPVLTVGIDAARNAGIAAAQIVATGDSELQERIVAFKKKQADAVRAKDHQLQTLGADVYLQRISRS